MKLEMKEKSEIEILQQILSDLSFLKQKIVVIEEEVDAISSDLHEVRPEYVKKLQKIEKNGKFHSFKTVDDLRKTIEVSD
ncbi:Uncharacterised protein [uncultured archaeon]|jgi:hypothetical protein|nr:Uncharacterised protein [uncultured archaeon]